MLACPHQAYVRLLLPSQSLQVVSLRNIGLMIAQHHEACGFPSMLCARGSLLCVHRERHGQGSPTYDLRGHPSILSCIPHHEADPSFVRALG
jgi:hypothetical protein